MYRSFRKGAFTVWLGVGVFFAADHAWAEPVNRPAACGVVQQGKVVELCSPLFIFRLDTAAGLRAQSVGERPAAQTLTLGDGPEVENPRWACPIDRCKPRRWKSLLGAD